MSDIPGFGAFFRAVYDFEPLPWQSRLAECVAAGQWPDEIGVATGLGKTSCLDIAVWALAAQAGRPPHERSAPTRTWYVVNRRLLVDAADLRATRLASLLREPESVGDVLQTTWDQSRVTVVRAVADALASMCGGRADCGPLHVSRLRGGAELGQRPPEPSQPSVILATVPMYASRFLFRGYGTSAAMRPIDAALAGTDSLVLLDEAHLARPLMRLMSQAAECDLGDPTTVLPEPRHRPRLVSLTATGDRISSSRFDLDDDDLRSPLVSRRLAATKPTEVVNTERAKLVQKMTEAAGELAVRRPGSAVVVFCNTVRTARAVQLLLSKASGLDVVLATGRQRNREAESVRRRLLDPVDGVTAGRSDPARVRSLVVVATQTLEVGADLDFDFLVTESAGARALVQRFGRLNRLGERPHAAAVICHPADVTDGIYGDEPIVVCERLSESGPLDLSPAAITDLVGTPSDEPARSGELLPEHLWEYVKTSQPQIGEAPPELFFDGFGDEDRSVSLCWRAHVPMSGERPVPTITERESVEVPIREGRAFLEGTGYDVVARLSPDRSVVESVPVATIRPGDVLLLQVTAGGYDEYGWNSESSQAVLDVSLLEAAVLPLVPDVIAAVATVATGDGAALARRLVSTLAMLSDDEPTPEVIEREQIDDLMECLSLLDPHPWLTASEWDGYLKRVSRAPRVTRPIEGAPYLIAPRTTDRWRRESLFLDAFDDLSFPCQSALLEDHLASVGEVAGRIGAALGLPADLHHGLVLAGQWHDMGKADARFQRWLDPEAEAGGLLAKSSLATSASEASRIRAGWPKGGRHEVLSARLLEASRPGLGDGEDDTDLWLHLVLTHHGHGRPVVLPVEDEVPVRVFVSLGGRTAAASGDLSRVEWEQPARFRRLCERYGIWGLALLEAAVRQADHAVSSVVEVG